MTTEVSSSPARARSGTRIHRLVDACVQVTPELRSVHPGGATEDLRHQPGIHQPPPTKWPQLADRNRIPRDNERAPLVKRTHDAPAVVAQFALADDLTHERSVALRATDRVDLRRWRVVTPWRRDRQPWPPTSSPQPMDDVTLQV